MGESLLELPVDFFVGERLRLTHHQQRECVERVVDFRRQNPDSLRLETNPQVLHPEVAFEVESSVPSPVLAAHWLTGTPLASTLPACGMYLGTTRGTNALLTRNGATTALITSSGFKDLLEIGDSNSSAPFSVNRQETFGTLLHVDRNQREATF